PGQFLQVRVDNSSDSFLRIPLSIHDVDYVANSIKILVQVVGSGSERLSELKAGENINLIYPLGNSFTLPSEGEKVLLTGGGCGMAPLLYLARKSKDAGADVSVALGFRNRERILDYSPFEAIGPVYLATEDGSVGTSGFITDIAAFRENSWDRVYCCGPEPMMKSIARECKARGLFCEVSLENLMACGIGACLCCVVNTVSGHLCTCTDGPVFNTKTLLW
ncbi:MAG TPA: dihydroorotate dehydrogenase electron transfer subunit, partial [Bacteroidales bacterium]|nr:dihydroorotate dehydrogenase electron transfer subunit [Bacteroidales bacterium]